MPPTTARRLQIRYARHAVGTVLLAGLILACSSCATSRLPDALTTDQAQSVAEHHPRFIVAVERYAYPGFSESLLGALTASGLFAQVVRREEAGDYDLVATVTEGIYGTATIPIVAILTLGIIPSVVDEHYGYRFSLAPKGGAAVNINAVYPSTTYLGWVAIPMWLSPSYSIGDANTSSRYLDFLRYRILAAGIPTQ